MSTNDQFVMSQVMLKCPYEPLHIVPQSSFHRHLTKCKSTYKNLYKQCPYNTYHHIIVMEYEKHCKQCPDRFKFMNQNDDEWIDEIQDDTISQKTIKTKIVNKSSQKQKCLTQYQSNEDHFQDDEWENNSYLSQKPTNKAKQNSKMPSNMQPNIQPIKNQNKKVQKEKNRPNNQQPPNNKACMPQTYPLQNYSSINPQPQYIQYLPPQYGNFQPVLNVPPQYQQPIIQYGQIPNQQHYAYQNNNPNYSGRIYEQQGNNGNSRFSQPSFNQFSNQNLNNYPQNTQQYFPPNNQAFNNMNQGGLYAYSNQNNQQYFDEKQYQQQYINQQKGQGPKANNFSKKGQYYQQQGYNQEYYDDYNGNYYQDYNEQQGYYQNDRDYQDYGNKYRNNEYKVSGRQYKKSNERR